MEKLKRTFSKNLSNLRKKKGLTQLELASELNYSDKAVSKWERADAIPDAYILKQIASFFNVSIDFLLEEHNEEEINEIEINEKEKDNLINKNRLIITFVSIFGIWLISLIVFIVLENLDINNTWYSFIIPIPLSFLLAFIFSCCWGNKVLKLITLSFFVWTILLVFFFVLDNWLVFLIGVPVQIITFLCFGIRKAN